MVQLSNAERAVIDDLLACLAEAVNDVESVDPQYANKTKLQKLLYLAILEFDLPVTYSWYLAGAVLPNDPATPDRLASALDELPRPDEPSIHESDADEPITEDWDASTMEPVDDIIERELDVSTSEDAVTSDSPEVSGDDEAGEDSEQDPLDPVLFTDSATMAPSATDRAEANISIDGVNRRELIDFYRRTLPDVWHQNTMRFLQNFYLEHAPEAYRELYVQSTHLRIRLLDIQEAIVAHLDGETPPTPIDDLVHAAELDVSDLHQSIRKSETLQETFGGFVDGTDLIEDALVMLTQLSPDEYTESHRDAMGTLLDYYYYCVWRYPCLLISIETATGQSAAELQSERQTRFTDFETTLQARGRDLEVTLDDAGLLPGYADYPVPDGDDVTDKISDLSNAYFDSSS
ncbi:hypothetical protein [Haloarchaeobius litoreus]|uniref:DUF8098 domain-containing protein n=1 Tax=Haloarchaeobius litoreus TaxID=755306 RepID=A0ABD6DN62_9EURY|nr:hypothetical protein [Haloarchaeobius litoreus]